VTVACCWPVVPPTIHRLHDCLLNCLASLAYLDSYRESTAHDNAMHLGINTRQSPVAIIWLMHQRGQKGIMYPHNQNTGTAAVTLPDLVLLRLECPGSRISHTGHNTRQQSCHKLGFSGTQVHQGYRAVLPALPALQGSVACATWQPPDHAEMPHRLGT
jgi:hypothetical protein